MLKFLGYEHFEKRVEINESWQGILADCSLKETCGMMKLKWQLDRKARQLILQLRRTLHNFHTEARICLVEHLQL